MHVSPIPHGDRRTAEVEALLGHDHPLARSEHRVRRVRTQIAVVAVLLAGSGVALLAELGDTRAVVLAAGVVLLWLTLCLASAAATRRECAVELIAGGRDALPLEAVRRQRARLQHPRRARALARSLEHIRGEAKAGAGRRRIGPPLFSPSVIRELDGELARTVDVLRGPAPNIVAVARAERLLGGERSPLYGEDPRRLGEELRRIGLAA